MGNEEVRSTQEPSGPAGQPTGALPDATDEREHAARAGVGAAEAEHPPTGTDADEVEPEEPADEALEGVATLLERLDAERATGRVEFVEEPMGALVLARGHLLAARSRSTPSLRLMLERYVELDDEAWRELVVGPDPLGRLIDDGHLTDDDVRHALAESLQLTLLELSLTGPRRIRFLPASPPDELPAVTFPAAEAAAELVRRRRRLGEIAARVRSLAVVPTLVRRVPPAADPICLSADAWCVLALVDGRRSVGRLIVDSHLGAFASLCAIDEAMAAGLVVADEATGAQRKGASVGRTGSGNMVSPVR